MKDDPPRDSTSLLTRVRCLECGHAYAKPRGGGTVARNPGCPRCGYIGWIDVAIEVTAQPPRHSGGGLRPLPGARRR